jgi:hypothetical protein
MKVKNTYHTLFEVSEQGLKLLGDFVSPSDAEEYCEQQNVRSYCILATVVCHEVEIKTIIKPARAIRLPEGSTGIDENASLESELKARETGKPIEGSRDQVSGPHKTSDTDPKNKKN